MQIDNRSPQQKQVNCFKITFMPNIIYFSNYFCWFQETFQEITSRKNGRQPYAEVIEKHSLHLVQLTALSQIPNSTGKCSFYFRHILCYESFHFLNISTAQYHTLKCFIVQNLTNLYTDISLIYNDSSSLRQPSKGFKYQKILCKALLKVAKLIDTTMKNDFVSKQTLPNSPSWNSELHLLEIYKLL